MIQTGRYHTPMPLPCRAHWDGPRAGALLRSVRTGLPQPSTPRMEHAFPSHSPALPACHTHLRLILHTISIKDHACITFHYAALAALQGLPGSASSGNGCNGLWLLFNVLVCALQCVPSGHACWVVSNSLWAVWCAWVIVRRPQRITLDGLCVREGDDFRILDPGG